MVSILKNNPYSTPAPVFYYCSIHSDLQLRRSEDDCERLSVAARESAAAVERMERRLAENAVAHRRVLEERRSLELQHQSLLHKCKFQSGLTC